MVGRLLEQGLNTIDFITISTLGNALDFGDATQLVQDSRTSSPTRGVFMGGTIHHHLIGRILLSI